MAITFVGKGTYVSGANSISVPPPAGIVANDVLILVVESNNIQPTDPGGWTRIDSWGSADYNVSMRVYYKITNGTESNLALTESSSSIRAIISAWRGVDTLSPITANTKGDAIGASQAFANPTTPVPNCMILLTVGFYDGATADTSNYSSWANASLTSITEGHDQHDTGGGGIAFVYGVKLLAGAVGNTSVSTDSTANECAYICMALRPAKENSGAFLPFF